MSTARALMILACLTASAFAELREVEFQGAKILTYTIPPSKVELYWGNSAGKPFRQFSVLQGHLEKQGKRLRFIMNAGLFEEDGRPCGLLVSDSKVVRSVNTANGEGNFYLKPNGVFFIDDKGAHILSTDEYVAGDFTPRVAVQSGPLLLDRGKTHHAFRIGSKNRLHRNGVGVLRDGSVLFAITAFDRENSVNFYQFTEFFREQGCASALFLDGDISMMFVDPKEPIRPGNFFGGIFAITEPAK